MADSTVKVVFLGDSKDLRKALDDVDDATNKASGRFADFGKKAAVGLGAGAVAAGAAFVHFGQMGLQLEAMGKKTQTVFEGATADVKAWADQNAKSFGLTDDKLEQLAASFGDLLKPMGFTAEQAAKMSKETVGLSGALSAWSGGQVTAAGASEILAKAMLGERDGLKALGISILDADVQGRLLLKGQQDLTGAALEQAKAVATQELIFEKSADAQKAWADGSFAAIQSQNSLRSSMGELQEQLATRLAPAFQAISTWLVEVGVPAFDSLVSWVRQNWPEIRDTIENVMNRVREVIETVLGAIQRFWGTWGDEIMLVVRTVFNFIRAWIESTLLVIQGIVNVIMGLIHGDFSRVWEGIRQVFEGALVYIRGLVEAAMGLLQAAISAGMTIVAGIFDQAWEAIKNATGAAAEWVVQRLKDLFIDLPAAVAGFAVDAGFYIIESLWAGLRHIAAAVADVGASVLNFLIGLPASVMQVAIDAGFYITAAIGTGFKFIIDRMATLASDIVVFLAGLPGRLWTYAVDIGTSVANTIIDSVGDLGSKIWEAIKDGIGSLAGKIRGALTFDIPGIDIPGFASGGVTKSRFQIVGENGPELAQLPPGTRVFNHGETTRMLSGAAGIGRAVGGGGNTFNIYIGKVNAESPAAVNNLAHTVGRELAVALRGSVN